MGLFPMCTLDIHTHTPHITLTHIHEREKKRKKGEKKEREEERRERERERAWRAQTKLGGTIFELGVGTCGLMLTHENRDGSVSKGEEAEIGESQSQSQSRRKTRCGDRF
ncbi:uncharacterized protein LOC130777081 [Actinidia eriantha]|uniref:uncharacterized protein LOC130777081 n=1 Tax=Actinidia eriantha TaxID=165200 RepID=UPI0025879C1C|nr:uncharacterized protein LOC130777081 [Actinidia eriantha]